MSTSIQVRPATLRDAKAIAEIHVAAWQDAYKGLLPDAALDALSVQKRQAFWREAIDLCEPQVMVAHLDNEPMGFVGFDRSRDKGTPSSTGEIWAMYANPVHWDKGVGLALWDAARDGCGHFCATSEHFASSSWLVSNASWAAPRRPKSAVHE